MCRKEATSVLKGGHLMCVERRAPLCGLKGGHMSVERRIPYAFCELKEGYYCVLKGEHMCVKRRALLVSRTEGTWVLKGGYLMHVLRWAPSVC